MIKLIDEKKTFRGITINCIEKEHDEMNIFFLDNGNIYISINNVESENYADLNITKENLIKLADIIKNNLDNMVR